MVKDEKTGAKKHTYTIDEKGGYKNPQPPILDLQCLPGAKCTNLEEEEGGEGGEDEGGIERQSPKLECIKHTR